MKNYLLTAILTITTLGAFAQDPAPLSDTDSLKLKVEKIESQIGFMNRLKISGYVQAQYQVADSAGDPSFNGGTFAPGNDKRFMLRRGRLKFSYSANPLTQMVFQFDVTERGAGVRDAYIKATEPILKVFSLQAGAFNRPFGF